MHRNPARGDHRPDRRALREHSQSHHSLRRDVIPVAKGCQSGKKYRSRDAGADENERGPFLQFFLVVKVVVVAMRVCRHVTTRQTDRQTDAREVLCDPPEWDFLYIDVTCRFRV